MSEKVRITTLIEDTAIGYDLFAEHGLSLWIEYHGKNILFDTGQTGNVAKNAKILGIDLAKTDAIVISHGHYDHTGGLDTVLSIAEHAEVYMHPAAVKQKFSLKSSGSGRNIGLPGNISTVVKVHSNNNKVVWTEKPTEIVPGLFVTGQIPRPDEFSAHRGHFFLDAEANEPDEMKDDQSLFFETDDGIVVVFGCAHAGIVNILRYIEQLVGSKKIYAVMGGMHLINSSDSEINQAIEVFAKYDIKKIGPAHCTGLDAAMKFRDAFPKKCFMCSVGSEVEF
ncbi:MAG: MBL fold metallo-hydrolase [Anaerohalosphaeraceae bacterium]|nr:MBL fold metallo-hydrolase [Anaerohalosphaeraceae bacterium]